jgi:hypothetical protein
MRPLLTTSAMAVAMLCAMGAAVSLEHEGVRTPTAPLLISGAASTPTTELQDRPPQSDDSSSADRRPARFVDLWVVISGVVGLLLVVQMVRIERSWRRGPDGEDASRNEFPSGGV